jgi:hypothetical protein
MNNSKITGFKAAAQSNCVRVRAGVGLSSIIFCFILAGCSGAPGPSAAEMNQAYEQILRQTQPLAVVYEPDSAAEQNTLRRTEAYFAQMTVESVLSDTTAVYAPDAWLYDNLAVIEGVNAIEAYFLNAAAEGNTISVVFLQVLRDGPDYFVRWKMTMEIDALQDGAPLVSYGITQFRFDQQGRVLMHRDFWDAATGLYEHLPVFGGLVRNVRSRLAGEH